MYILCSCREHRQHASLPDLKEAAHNISNFPYNDKNFQNLLLLYFCVCVLFTTTCPRANGAKRRSGRKPGARVTNSALAFTYIRIMRCYIAQWHSGIKSRPIFWIWTLDGFFIIFTFFCKNIERVKMTTILNTSCSENMVVWIPMRGVAACIYF